MVALKLPDSVYQRLLEQANQRGVSVEQWLEQVSQRKQAPLHPLAAIGDHQRTVLLYNLLLEHYPDGLIAMFDRDLRFTIANGEGLRRIGMSSADLEGKRLRDVFPPEICERDEPNLLAALTGEKRTAIVEMNDQYFQVTTLPIRDERGEIICGMIISRNITDVRRAELAYRQVIDQLELAIKTAKLGIWQLDLKTGRLDWNAQMFEIYGISPLAFSGDLKTWQYAVHPDDRADADAAFQRILTDGQVFDVRFRIIRPGGETRYLKASGCALCDANGAVTELVGANLDITDHEQAKRALQSSEARYRALFNGSSNPIVVYDENATITMINEVGARNLGIPPDEAVGRPLADFFPDNHAMTLDRIQQVLASGESLYVEDQIVLNGKQKWYWSSVQPIHEQMSGDGKVQIISYDITERKQNELLEAERAKLALELEQERALTQARSKLLSIISHEFRTPLTVIMSSADLLSTYSDRLSAQKRQERLMSIIAQVRHLDRMLEEIEMLLHANRAFLNYRPVMTDLAMFCQVLSAEASAVMPPSHQLEVNTAFTDRYIPFDPDLMRHALMNLLSNAIKYSPRGGIVALSVQQTDSGYEFSVRDQGIGIPPDEQARMFMPFERASNVGTIRGTGLGLSIVQEVAELHNGSIRLESEVDVGSVFTLIIPMK